MIPWDRQLSKRHMKRGYVNVQEEVNDSSAIAKVSPQ